MKRFAINTLAAAALLAGGLTLTGATSAKVVGGSQTTNLTGPSCGSCHCSTGQGCRSGWTGCECYNP